MPEEETQDTPKPYITFASDGKAWSVDTNVQNWEWHILKIAAEIKKTL